MAFFSKLLNRAQASVDTAIDHAVNRVIIAVPFVVAAAFGTVALSFRLTREFGPEIGNLIIAGIFAAVGLVCALLLRTKSPQPQTTEQETPEALKSEDQAEAEAFSGVDRDLIMAALTSAAPVALPVVLRFVLRNMPLVLAVLGAIFVMLRPTDGEPKEQRAPQEGQAA